MLYVFQMDIGQMLTFDISLLTETVARLQVEIYKTTGIGVDQQILLLSGGRSLKADQSVMTYNGAGVDTNPVFLFSKLAIESQEPPVIRSFMIAKDAVVALKERVTDALKIRPSYDTVNLRAKLAVQMRDSASNIYNYCKNEFQEQHLQHQGWAAVIANLEEIADALQRTEIKFTKIFNAFFPVKESHFKMLEGFGEILNLMNQIPLLESLKSSCDDGMESKFKSSDRCVGSSIHSDPSTLLEWICSQAQNQGIDCLHQKCEDDLNMFNEVMFESYDKQVQDLLLAVRMDPTQMKELVGIERRLSELEKRLNEAKRISTSQNDMAQGFIQHQAKLGSLPDVSSILPDLCESHKQQLVQMLEYQQRIVALQNNFRNSKQEMSRNIHQRLGWVMHVETKIAKLDSELIFHIKTLKVLECNLELLSQIKISPQVYADLILETARRRKFSRKFSKRKLYNVHKGAMIKDGELTDSLLQHSELGLVKWAEVLEVDANRLYEAETQRRKQFSQKHGEHFLTHTMFKGFEDKPPSITTKVPRLLDAKLPEISTDEISWLKSSVPELESSLSLKESPDQFPEDLLCTYSKDKTPLNVMHVQPNGNIQTPCVVTAAEGPATPFTIPSRVTPKESQHQHTVPNMAGPSKKDASVETSVKNVANKSSQGDTKSRVSVEIQTNADLLCLDNKCVGTGDELESESKTGASGKQISNTESSSPHSSTEFATADFYFEDSMPSPMVETDKKAAVPIKSESKEDLVTQLKEKGNVIEELNDLLKQREEEIDKLQNELRTQRGENSEHLEFFSLIGPLEEAESDHKDVSESKEVESACCQTDSTVDDRVKDLEQKLEKLTIDLDQSQLCLIKAEESLQTVQEQEQTMEEKNQSLIELLRHEITDKNDDLMKTKEDLDARVEELTMLKEALNVANSERDQIQADLDGSNERVKTLQRNFHDFVSKSKMSVPLIREDLEVLKVSMKENLSHLDAFNTSVMTEIEKQCLSFKTVVSTLEKEKEQMVLEATMLKEELTKSKEEGGNEMINLKSEIDSLIKQLAQQAESFDINCTEQKNEFDSTLKDMETRHALSMELELEKCKEELGETIVEWEKKYGEEKDLKSRLLKDIDSLKNAFENEKENIEALHLCAISNLKVKHESMMDQHMTDWQGKLDDCKSQIQALEMEAIATAAAVGKEKQDSLDSLKKQLMTEHDEDNKDFIQRHREQVEKYTKMVEEQQLNHAYKLTELKKAFDIEREMYQSELKKYKDNEMTHSYTQTALLDEIISLTSSVSDGMDEPLSAKAQEDTELKSPEPSDEESLSRQIEKSCATDDVKRMEEKLQQVIIENSELKEKLRSRGMNDIPDFGGSPDMDKSQYNNMMQTSATGRSFILMDKDKQPSQFYHSTDEDKLKDQKIIHLEKRIMEMSMTGTNKSQTQDKISFRGCDMGDLVLLCLDEKHDQYVVFTVGTNLHFLHSDSLEGLGLKGDDAASRKPWILAEVLDKEYCLAKKPNNRFRVPQGTCFYRVKCQPWKCEVDLTRHKDKDSARQKTIRNEQGVVGGKAKKADKREK